MDGGPEPHTVKLRGEGPSVRAHLQPFLGLGELRLSIAYYTGFFPGYVLGSWTLRDAEGTLLLLAGSFVDEALAGWRSPFEDLAFVDRDCAPRLSPPGTFPDSWRPLALEVDTTVERLDVYHGQQLTVQTAESDYEVSVLRARTYEADS